jgi:hypothetical protein
MKKNAKEIILNAHDRAVGDKRLHEKLCYVTVDGNAHSVESEFFRHVYKSHGDAAKEARRGQVKIVRADFAALPGIIEHPDNVKKTKTRSGQNAITYIKRVNGTIYFVEEVRKGRILMAKTMWKKKASAPNAAGNQPPGLNAQNATGIKDNITKKGGNVNSNNSIVILLIGIATALFLRD